MSRYPWPASQIGQSEMKILYEERLRTGKAITDLVKEAISGYYGREVKKKWSALKAA